MLVPALFPLLCSLVRCERIFNLLLLLLIIIIIVLVIVVVILSVFGVRIFFFLNVRKVHPIDYVMNVILVIGGISSSGQDLFHRQLVVAFVDWKISLFSNGGTIFVSRC